MMQKMMLTVLAMLLLLTANVLAKSTTYGKGVTVREVAPGSALLSDSVPSSAQRCEGLGQGNHAV